MAGFAVSFQIDASQESGFLVKCHLTTRNTPTWKIEINNLSWELSFLCTLHFFALLFLKMQQKKPKSNLLFWLRIRKHWGRGNCPAWDFWVFFEVTCFEHGKHFATDLAWPWDEGCGQFLIHRTLYVHLYSSGAYCSAPVRSTPTVQDRGAYWCPVVQSLQGMLGLIFLSDFNSEDRGAGGCEKRRLLFSRACASLPSFCRTSRPGWASGLQISSPLRDGVSVLTACEQQSQCRGTARLAS